MVQSTQLLTPTHGTYRSHQFPLCQQCTPNTTKRHIYNPTGTQALPPFLSPPALPQGHCCLKSVFQSSQEASLNEPIHFHKGFFPLFNYKIWWGGKQWWKANASVPTFHLEAWKAKSEWQSSEYLCVYTRSSFKANICPQTLTNTDV